MLNMHPHPQQHWSLPDTMTTRSAALITIGLIAVLLAFVALAAMFSGEISERAGGIVTTVLGSFATVLAGLLLFLRVETVNSKVDDAASHAETAASHAETAAKRAAIVEQKVEGVHHDVLNGGLRENVKRAIREAEQEPSVRENRISNVVRGVSQDRHAQQGIDSVLINRAALDDLKRRAAEREGN